MTVFHRRESRLTRAAYEVGAVLLAIFTVAAIIHIGRHVVIFVAKTIGGAA